MFCIREGKLDVGDQPQSGVESDRYRYSVSRVLGTVLGRIERGNKDTMLIRQISSKWGGVTESYKTNAHTRIGISWLAQVDEATLTGDASDHSV